MQRIRSACLSAAAALMLMACGGGGDDSPPPGPYAARAALAQWLLAGASWTLNGSSSNGQAFSVTIGFAPAAAGPFPIGGGVFARSLETLTIASAGQPTSSVTQTLYFDAATLDFIGAEADGSCSVATSNTALPTSTPLGSSGALFAQSDLDGCTTTSSALGTSANRWSVEADGSVALLCWSLTSQDVGGTPNGSESICAEIAPDGSLGTRARFAASSAGVSIAARNF